MKIIGISGMARSGKDTLAKMLIEQAGGGVVLSFASPIREFIAGLLGIPLSQLTDGPTKERPIKELGGKSPRYLMQTLGTEWGREMVDPDLWVKIAQWKIDALRRGSCVPKLVVFSDVRFDNEASMLRSQGGRIVLLNRPSLELVMHHVSEAGLSDIGPRDTVVENAGSLSDLRQAARMILDQN
jgi:hypothetical protein